MTAQDVPSMDDLHVSIAAPETAPDRGDVIRTMAEAMQADPRTKSWGWHDWLTGMTDYADALDGPGQDQSGGQEVGRDVVAEIRAHMHALDRLTSTYSHLRSTRAGDHLLEDIRAHISPVLGLLAAQHGRPDGAGGQ